VVKKYQANLKDVGEWLHLPEEPSNCRHAWHLFVVQLEIEKLKINRNQFIEKMAEQGVECGVHYQPIFDLTYYSNFFSLNLDKYPNAHRAGQRVVSLPLYPTLEPADVDYVCECAVEILKDNCR
jgi:perosamine synthetase